MAVSQSLKNSVNSEERNMDEIRDSLFFATAKDPGFKNGGDFELSLKYCLDNGISEAELFQEDDGKEIPIEVNEENFSTICASLRTNFSKKKLDVAKKMGRQLYPEESEEKKNNSTQSRFTRTVHRMEKRNEQSGRNSGSQNTGTNGISTGTIIATAVAAAVLIGIGIAAIIQKL